MPKNAPTMREMFGTGTSLLPAAALRENLNDLDEEDVRLDKYSRYSQGGKGLRGRIKQDSNIVISSDPTRGRQITEIYQDSPNGYKLRDGAPEEFEQAVKFYSFHLRQFTLEYPEEHGILHFILAKLFFKEYLETKSKEFKAKYMENTIFHLNKSRNVLRYDSHPIMYGVMGIMLAQMFRFRAQSMNERSVLSGRGTTLESINLGLAAVLEALPLFLTIKQYTAEYALCSLEIGWLYFLQMDHPEYDSHNKKEDDEVRELSISALNRSMDCCISAISAPKDEKPRDWDPADPKTYPLHINLLTQFHPLQRCRGMAMYVQARVFQDWGIDIMDHIRLAFDCYSDCVKKQYLGNFSSEMEWGDAHHRMATLIFRYPKLVDEDYVEEKDSGSSMNSSISKMHVNSGIHLDSAINHLILALRCQSLGSSRLMDVHFHLSQCLLDKLYVIIDSVPQNMSLTKVLGETEGIELIENVEKHLLEALKRVTSASTETTQDAYVYYFSSLKIAEIKMLEAAASPDLAIGQREALFFESVGYVIDALNSRPLSDNLDLHYIAMNQLEQMLVAGKKYYAAVKALSKLILGLSCLVNRVHFNNMDMHTKLWDEINRQISMTLHVDIKISSWSKKHLGPLRITDSPAKGYAIWAFEDDIELSRKAKPSLIDPSHFASSYDDTNEISFGDTHGTNRLSEGIAGLTPKPPSTIPPPSPLTKRRVQRVLPSTPSTDALFDISAKPPEGAVPLAAMGHFPDPQHLQKIGREGVMESPYAHRIRMRVIQADEVLQRSALDAAAAAAETQKLAMTSSNLRNSSPSSPSSSSSTSPHSVSPDGKTTAVKRRTFFGFSSHSQDSYDEKKKEGSQSLRVPPSKNADVPTANLAATRVASAKDMTRLSKDLSKKYESEGESESQAHKAHLDALKNDLDGRPRSSSLFGGIASFLGFSRPFSSSSSSSRRLVSHRQSVNLKLKAELWASLSTFLTFNILSRQSRLLLLLRSRALNLIRGERANSVFSSFPLELKKDYKDHVAGLRKACREIILPPNSLKELSRRPFDDLKTIFSSHASVYRLMVEFEVFLRDRVMKEDQFLPLIHSSQTLSREFTEFDRTVLNPAMLIANMKSEDEFVLLQAQLKEEREKALASMSKTNTGANDRTSYHLKRKSRIEEEEEENRIGMMTHKLSQTLDATNLLGGSREMFQRYLSENECMIIWHLPSAQSQVIQAVLVWRENSQSTSDSKREQPKPMKGKNVHASEGSSESSTSGGRRSSATESENHDSHPREEIHQNTQSSRPMGIVMEVAKSDVDSNQINYLVHSWIEAINSRPNAKRLPQCQDVLFAMSCALSITELLLMIPRHVDTLIMCSSIPTMLAIPWHLLLIEVVSEDIVDLKMTDPEMLRQQVKATSLNPEVISSSYNYELGNIQESTSASTVDIATVHLIEKYVVLLGPTLQLFELNETYNEKLKHNTGMHRLCCVDGDYGPNKKGGVRSTELEAAIASSVWSSDPMDYHVIMGEDAVKSKLKTASYEQEKEAWRKAIAQGDKPRRYSVIDEYAGAKNEQARRKTHVGDTRESIRVVSVHKPADAEDPEMNLDSDEETTVINNRKALFSCRILHFAAHRKNYDYGHRDCGLVLPISISKPADPRKDATYAMKFSASFVGDPSGLERDYLDPSSVVSQLYLKNCALCILSRFSVCDDGSTSNSFDATAALLESFHFAGATTLMYPLWNAISSGHSTLAHIMFLLRFYSELPSFCRAKRSVALAARNAQLWLRAATADDIIAYISRSPLEEKVKMELIEEMESYVTASLASSPVKGSSGRPGEVLENKLSQTSDIMNAEKIEGTKGNRLGGDRKFFTHFMNWGFFVVSGHGGNVHHPDLFSGEGVVYDKKLLKKHHIQNVVIPEDSANIHKAAVDFEPDNPEFEIEILKMEGRFEEADELKRALERQRQEKFDRKVKYMKSVANRAKQAVVDSLNAFDKAILVQDSDSVSCSDSEDDSAHHNFLDEDGNTIIKKPKSSSKSRKNKMKTNVSSKDSEEELHGFQKYLTENSSVLDKRKVDPLERVKFHFGYGGKTSATPLGTAGETVVDPSQWEKNANEKLEERQHREIAKHSWYQVNSSQNNGAPVEQESFEAQMARFDEENDGDEEESDEDEDETRGVRKLKNAAKKQAKRLKKTVKEIGSEVRSYNEAAKVAQDMLSSLPKRAHLDVAQRNNRVPSRDTAAVEPIEEVPKLGGREQCIIG